MAERSAVVYIQPLLIVSCWCAYLIKYFQRYIELLVYNTRLYSCMHTCVHNITNSYFKLYVLVILRLLALEGGAGQLDTDGPAGPAEPGEQEQR